MSKTKHPDLAYIWMEHYKKKYPDGYQVSQYYKLYGKYVKEHYGQESVRMAVERIPGEKISEYLGCAVNGKTGFQSNRFLLRGAIEISLTKRLEGSIQSGIKQTLIPDTV